MKRVTIVCDGCGAEAPDAYRIAPGWVWFSTEHACPACAPKARAHEEAHHRYRRRQDEAIKPAENNAGNPLPPRSLLLESQWLYDGPTAAAIAGWARRAACERVLDLDHPATYGWLEHQAREAIGLRENGWVWRSSIGARHWFVTDGNGNQLGEGPTRAEAWLAAWEAVAQSQPGAPAPREEGGTR